MVVSTAPSQDHRPLTHRSTPGLAEYRKRRTRIVEFSSLANCQAATPNDQNLLDINHISRFYNTTLEVGFRIGGLLGSGAGASSSGH